MKRITIRTVASFSLIIVGATDEQIDAALEKWAEGDDCGCALDDLVSQNLIVETTRIEDILTEPPSTDRKYRVVNGVLRLVVG